MGATDSPRMWMCIFLLNKIIIKKRIKENSLYSLLEFNRTKVRFEAVFAKKTDIILKEYETADGSLINVYTLSPDNLLDEKIAAFIKRNKIRDLYDIFFLLRFVSKRRFIPIKKIVAVDVIDEENLKTLIISGLVPSSDEMKKYIEQWAR